MIISITGKLHSGKDMVAECIQIATFLDIAKIPFSESAFEYQLKSGSYKAKNYWQIKKFADKLKETIALWLGISREDLEKDEVKKRILPDEWQKYEISKNGEELLLHFYTELEAKEYCERLTSSQAKYTYSISKRTVRWLMQYIGTPLFRDRIHRDIHINGLFSNYKGITEESRLAYFENEGVSNIPQLKQNDRLTYNVIKGGYFDSRSKWLITDTRFRNEVDRVDVHGGLKLNVLRSFDLRFPEYAPLVDSNNRYSIPKDLEQLDPELYTVLTHESETALDKYKDFHKVLENNGSKYDLFLKIAGILRDKGFV